MYSAPLVEEARRSKQVGAGVDNRAGRGFEQRRGDTDPPRLRSTHGEITQLEAIGKQQALTSNSQLYTNNRSTTFRYEKPLRVRTLKLWIIATLSYLRLHDKGCPRPPTARTMHPTIPTVANIKGMQRQRQELSSLEIRRSSQLARELFI